MDKSTSVNSLSFRPVSLSPKTRIFKLTATAPTSALISSSWSPYWKAYLDNRPIAIQQARNLMVIYVPKGRHKLRLEISNWSWVKIIALAISLMTAVGGIFLFVNSNRAVIKKQPDKHLL